MFIFYKQIDILWHKGNKNRQYYTLTAKSAAFIKQLIATHLININILNFNDFFCKTQNKITKSFNWYLSLNLKSIKSFHFLSKSYLACFPIHISPFAVFFNQSNVIFKRGCCIVNKLKNNISLFINITTFVIFCDRR